MERFVVEVAPGHCQSIQVLNRVLGQFQLPRIDQLKKKDSQADFNGDKGFVLEDDVLKCVSTILLHLEALNLKPNATSQ